MEMSLVREGVRDAPLISSGSRGGVHHIRPQSLPCPRNHPCITMSRVHWWWQVWKDAPVEVVQLEEGPNVKVVAGIPFHISIAISIMKVVTHI